MRRNASRHIFSLHRQRLRVTVGAVLLSDKMTLNPPFQDGQGVHLLMVKPLLKCSSSILRRLSQGSPHVPRCWLDVPLVNSFLICHTSELFASTLHLRTPQILTF
jgi:hypothetical protein